MLNIFRRLLSPKSVVLDFPYPYKGLLAFSSDVEFTSWDIQKKLIDAFNAYHIPVSFSLWTYGDNDHTWCCFKDDGTEQDYIGDVMDLCQKGVFDTFHSFGGITDGKGTFLNRERFQKSYALFQKYNVTFPIYTNHGSVLDTQNIGGVDATYQKGDDPYHAHYHLDLTMQHGCRYFWTDIDYDNEQCLFDVKVKPFHPPLFRVMTCRDGQKLLCFKRFRGTNDGAPTLTNFNVQLKTYLNSSKNGYTIMYQHFGAKRDENRKAYSAQEPFFDEETKELLNNLQVLHTEKNICILPCSTLLNFARVQWVKPWTIEEKKDRITVSFYKEKKRDGMSFCFEKEDFQGFSLSTSLKKHILLLYEGTPLPFSISFEKNKKIIHIPFAHQKSS